MTLRFPPPWKVEQTDARGPASEVLQNLLRDLPPDRFTLAWLSKYLDRGSFGVIVLILALIAMAPGLSYVAGLLLLAPAIEMIAGRSAPTFPRRIADRPLPSRRLAGIVQRVVPSLTYVEKVIRPRWQLPLGATERLVGVAVLLLTVLLLLTPLPFIQVVPGLIIVVLAIGYVEDDGLLLSLGLLAALSLVGASATAVWGLISAAAAIAG
ncbi:MAG TPA: exopolysaccharide biosynthesis protein [Xanthobacteraceae bacterium]